MAYHFNWSHDDVLGMPHWERHRWCEEISAINDRRNRESGGGPGSGPPGGGSPGGPTEGGGIELVNPEFEG